jgi:hypothetical protein
MRIHLDTMPLSSWASIPIACPSYFHTALQLLDNSETAKGTRENRIDF